MKRLFYSILWLFVFPLFSCRHNRLDVDVAEVTLPSIETKRLEKDLFEMPLDSIVPKTSMMIQKYGSFYPLFITKIINNGGIKDSSYAYNLKQFLSDKDMRSAYNDCVKEFPNLDFLNEALTEAFKHFHYYFPEKKIPQVVSYMSGFNYSVATNDSTLGIGLEMYLGSKNKFYTMLQFPNYKTLAMNKTYMAPDALKAWLLSEFENNLDKTDFLSEIIHYGKIMYCTDALLPNTNDSLKIGFTSQQLDWCKKNELNMWTYFIQNKILYSTELKDIMKFTHEGPFTSAFSKSSPARTGYWMGWQIVRAYMDTNTDVTLAALMNEVDAQKILAQSKYKPEK